MPPSAVIRPCHSGDQPHLYDICLRTGDRGTDASTRCTHPELLGDYYAVPYAVRESELCLMLEMEDTPVGYVLGTADTPAFLTWFNEQWLPEIRLKYRSVPPVPGAADAWLLERLAEDATAPQCVGEYPAHLHIDLLPIAQGTGWGRRMITRWLDVVRAHGVAGVHLGVSKANERAIGFYEHVGFRRIEDAGGAWIYGIRWT